MIVLRQMQEQLSSRIVVHKKVKMLSRLESGVQSYCVRVGTESNHVFTFTKLSHQCIIVCNSLFAYSLQSQY